MKKICRSTITIFIISLLICGVAFAEKKKHKTGKVYDVEGVININSAGINELHILPGIGEKKADNIVAFRKKNGNFSTIDDIKRVKGIGEKIFGKIKNHIVLEGETNLKKI